MRVLVALVVWLAAIIGAVALGSAVETAVGPGKSSTGASASTGTAGGAGSGTFDASAIAATDPKSLFRSANFPRALATARAQLGTNAQVDNFALYPGYLTITAVKGDREISFYSDAQGTVHVSSMPANPVASTVFPLSRIDPKTPSAMAHSISRRANVRASQLHYMVVEVDPTTNQLTWLVYPQQGGRVEYFEAPGAAGPLREQLATGGVQQVALAR